MYRQMKWFSRKDEVVEAYLKQPETLSLTEKRFPVEYELGLKKQRRYFFLTCDEIHWLNGCKEESERRYNECIMRDRECKLYMDCDKKGLNAAPKESEILEYVSIIQQRVDDLLKSYGSEGCQMPLVFNSSTKDKLSVHLIWKDVWFETPRHCYAFIKECNIQSVRGVDVDYNVYALTTLYRSLRMPYNVKYGVNVPLTLIGAIDPRYVESNFSCGLVSFHSKFSEKHRKLCVMQHLVPVSLPDSNPQRSLCLPISGLSGNGELSLEIVSDAVVQWMDFIYPNFRMECFKLNYETGQFRFVCKLWCMCAKRYHSSNKTYIFNRQSGEMCATCPDVECRMTVNLPFTMHEVVKAREPISLDFSFLPLLTLKRQRT